MSRFGSSVTTRPVRRESYHEQHQEPSEGHAEGVPEFPGALPGLHHYGTHAAVPVEHELEVGPADPYYGKGGMAHGVVAPPRHGGRPTARPEDRREHGTRDAEVIELAPRPDPVPVYQVELGGGAAPLKRAALRAVPVPLPGADPIVMVPRNTRRSSVRLLNEATIPVRILFDLAASGGALLPASMSSYLEVDTADEICAYVPAIVQPSTPAVPASGVAVQNTNAFPVQVVITGGTLTAVVVNGITVGTAAGTYVVPAYGSISTTNTGAPTWAWSNAAAVVAPALISVIEQYDVPAGG